MIDVVICILPFPRKQLNLRSDHREHRARGISPVVRIHNCYYRGPERKGILFSNSDPDGQRTFWISLIMSAGSIELVVFIDHVNLNERGLISPGVVLLPDVFISLVVAPDRSIVP